MKRRMRRGFRVSDLPLEDRVEFILECGKKACEELGLKTKHKRMVVDRWIRAEEEKDKPIKRYQRRGR